MLIGIDVGGTKTHIRAFAATAEEVRGTRILDVVVPTTQWRLGGLLEDAGNARRLIELVHAGLSEVGAGEPAMLAGSALAVGAHGLDSDQQILEFAPGLAAAHPGPTLAVNDTELLVPASGLDRGIALVVGTGSKVVGHDVHGSSIAIGGHGFLAGDPGSAPQLVLAAVKAALIAYDERRLDDPMLGMLGSFYDCATPVDLADHFNRQADLLGWAGAAPVVFAAADAGSTVATAVIEDAADQLAADIARAVHRGAAGEHVVCAGGVITHQPRLVAAFEQALLARGLQHRVLLLSAPPVDGAVVLAGALAAGLAGNDADGSLILTAPTA